MEHALYVVCYRKFRMWGRKLINIAHSVLIIVQFMREWKGPLETKSDWRNAIFSGMIGALAFAFTHSFWFNAVEAEVYALSMFFSALVIWLTLVWAQKSNQKGLLKYLFLIVYLIGLGATVHLLSILVLPFVVMIIYFKKCL